MTSREYKLYSVAILLALNLMLWVTLRLDVKIIDGGVVALSGFPLPWYRSSVMGTGDIEISIPLFLIDFIFYCAVAGLMLRLLAKQFSALKSQHSVVVALLVFMLVPVVVNMTLRFVGGDWSGWVLLPWDGWDGSVSRAYLAHGVGSFTPSPTITP